VASTLRCAVVIPSFLQRGISCSPLTYPPSNRNSSCLSRLARQRCPVRHVRRGTSLASSQEDKSSCWMDESPINGAAHEGSLPHRPALEAGPERCRLGWKRRSRQRGGATASWHGIRAAPLRRGPLHHFGARCLDPSPKRGHGEPHRRAQHAVNAIVSSRRTCRKDLGSTTRTYARNHEILRKLRMTRLLRRRAQPHSWGFRELAVRIYPPVAGADASTLQISLIGHDCLGRCTRDDISGKHRG